MPEALDLFGGSGGTHLGLLDAGYEAQSLDIWPVSITTQTTNGHDAVVCDLKDRTIKWKRRGATVDLVWGSAPCQPFSRAAAETSKGLADKRNCVPDLMRIVGKIKPRLVLMENVQGFASPKFRWYVDSMVLKLRSWGYKVAWKVLNCADYGVPQTRMRWFLIARLDGKCVWPKPTHSKRHEEDGLKPWVPMAKALGWKKKDPWWLERRNDQTNCVEIGEVDPYWIFTRPATTIAGRLLVPDPGANANRFNGKTKSRNDGYKIEPEEMAILQGFPNDYKFVGSDAQKATQIGNAVPPVMAYRLARANRER